MHFQDRAGVYVGGRGEEKEKDIWPPVMKSGRSRWTYGKIGDSEQPISKQSAKTRKYNSIIREWNIVSGKNQYNCLITNQVPQIFIGHFEVARETGFRCCVDRIALWGCFVDEFWSGEFLPVWYFLKNNRANKLQIELEVVGQPIQLLSTGKKVCITIQTSFLNADSAVFDDSS